MILLKITDIRHFMKKLLFDSETAFDQFLLAEASITAGNTFTIDGHINKDFYSEEETALFIETAKASGRIYSPLLSRWETVKAHCFQLIKGRKTPLAFRFVFYLAPENIERFISSIETSLTASDIDGLSLNIKYDGTTLSCTCATSLKLFTMDKSVEHAWDTMIKRFLTKQEISFEEL